MPALRTTQPSNRNFLSPTGFQMVVRKIPDTVFFVTKLSVPGMNLPPATMGTPFVQMPEPGDHIEYEPLQVSFKLNEDLSNYVELYTWVRQLGFSESHEERARLDARPAGLREKSEISLFVLSSKKNPIMELVYHDAFPVSLSGWDMSHGERDIKTIDVTATFRYTTFTLIRPSEYEPVDGQSYYD